MDLTKNIEEPLLACVPAHGRSLADIAGALTDWGSVSLWEQCASHVKPSSPPFHQPGRYHYLSLGEHSHLKIQSDRVHMVFPKGKDAVAGTTTEADSSPLAEFADNPFTAIAAYLSRYENRISPAALSAKVARDLPPFIGGLVGFIGYDTARYLEHLPAISEHPREPDVYLKAIESLLVLDTREDEFLIFTWPRGVRTDSTTNNQQENAERMQRIREAVEAKAPKEQTHSPVVHTYQEGDSQLPYECAYDCDAFVERVSKAKDYIRAGDVFQVVLGNEIYVRQAVEPLELYQTLTDINPSPYHFCFSFDDNLSLVGASPEVMMRANAPDPRSHVQMRLVAGTYPRGATPEEESARIQALQSDQKEHAEHIMLVDHCRNDIGRMADIGSVEVSDLCSVEPYLDVYHLVSQVSGRLREDCSILDALQAAFPIATLTGTPKIRAMEIIAELETPSRGSFGGAMVLVGTDGFLDSAVIIRTALLGEKETIIRAGAGIVHDSVPEREYQECLWKARALLHALSCSRESES